MFHCALLSTPRRTSHIPHIYFTNPPRYAVHFFSPILSTNNRMLLCQMCDNSTLARHHLPLSTSFTFDIENSAQSTESENKNYSQLKFNSLQFACCERSGENVKRTKESGMGMEMATFKFSRIFNDDIGCRQSLFRYEMASSSSSHTIARRFDDPHFNALFALSTRLVFPLRPVGRWRGKMKNFQMANFYRSLLFILTLGSRIFRGMGGREIFAEGEGEEKTFKKIYCADHHKIIPDFNISTFLALAQRKNFPPPTNSAKIFTLRLCDDIHPPLAAAAAARTTLITNNNSLPLLSLLQSTFDSTFYCAHRRPHSTQHKHSVIFHIIWLLLLFAQSLHFRYT